MNLMTPLGLAPLDLISLVRGYLRRGNLLANARDFFPSAIKNMETRKYSPQDFIQAMNEALGNGDLNEASKLSVAAIAHYPEHEEIQKYARILAPPKTTFHKLPPDPYAKIHQDWVMQHRTEYRGQWIALRQGELIADAASADELADKIEAQFDNPKGKGIFITVVY